MLFVDYTRIAAYGVAGFLWNTDELSWDGIELTEVETNLVRGLGWDSPAGRKVQFSVDLSTGSVAGGSSPAMYKVPSRL
jgi:hypothetical protein